MNKKEGLRYNEGKLRLDLITPEIIKGIGEVLTKGAEKYADRNWELGMSWSKVIASLKRHLFAFENGEDYDKETGLLHINHILCNAGFLSTYYKNHPEFDDRPNTFFDKKVALDIDGVLADFNKSVKEKYNIKNNPDHWYYSYEFKKSELWSELSQDKDFWLNLEPLIKGEELPFDPVCYVTSRPVPKEWCEEWLEKNNFPCVPVHVANGSKVDKLKELTEIHNIDWFVDDRYDNFVELNKNGIFTYLFDQPWNSKYDVGHKRIKSLNDLVK